MRIPKGYTEQQVINVITTIAKKLSRRFKFGYYGEDDIYQESFIFGMSALKDFRPSKGELGAFLATHMKNRLINLKRDKLSRHANSIPCQVCEKNKDKSKKCINQLDCSIYQKWIVRNKTKRSLMQPVNIGIGYDKEDGFKLDNGIELKDMVDKIDQKLPAHYRINYRKMIEGGKITYNKKSKLMNLIKNIVYGADDIEEENNGEK